MIKSKAKISKQIGKKKNRDLVKTICLAKKYKNWLEVASILSGPRRKMKSLNLKEINDNVKEGDKIVIPGKVLSEGELNKKIKIVALNFSEKAREKLNAKGCEIRSIKEEIEKNPKEELKILKFVNKKEIKNENH